MVKFMRSHSEVGWRRTIEVGGLFPRNQFMYKLVAIVWLWVAMNQPRATSLPRWIRRKETSPMLVRFQKSIFHVLRKLLSHGDFFSDRINRKMAAVTVSPPFLWVPQPVQLFPWAISLLSVFATPPFPFTCITLSAGISCCCVPPPWDHPSAKPFQTTPYHVQNPTTSRGRMDIILDCIHSYFCLESSKYWMHALANLGFFRPLIGYKEMHDCSFISFHCLSSVLCHATSKALSFLLPHFPATPLEGSNSRLSVFNTDKCRLYSRPHFLGYFLW